MPIIEPAIRPPAEAESFLLQVTLGCSADSCTFCGAYKNKPFQVKSSGEVSADIEEHARIYPDTRRVFLMDGDALVLSNARLIPILRSLSKFFFRLRRVSSYANGRNISKKTDSELKELYENKLSLFYMGLESGSQAVLDMRKKSSTVEEMVRGVVRASAMNIKSSVIVLLGLGAREHSREHVAGTIEALNRMQPRYLSFLSLMTIPGTPLAQEARKGKFAHLTPAELLKESYDIIEGLVLEKTIFRSDHASNYLALEGVLPKDKDKLLAVLEKALSGKISLRPDILRGL